MTETLDAPFSDQASVARPEPAPLVVALRAALGKVEAAVAEPDAVEMVHDARKALKEYRSLLRLLATDAARAARRHAAEVARGLAQARDCATACEALDLLDEAGLALSCDIAAARAVIGAVPAADDAAPLRAHLAAFVADARARLSGGLEDEAAAVDLVEGLRKGYRAARRGVFGSATAMHETRKSVVAHRYQMGFLASAFSGRGATRAGRAQRLRDMLGAHHDIEVLRPMLHAAAGSLGEGALERLDIAMARLQKRLRRQAVRLHRDLFRRSPAKFARRFRRRIEAPAAA